MMRRRFFVTAATAMGMTLLLPLVSGRARAWADEHKGNDHKSDDHRDEDDEEDQEKVTVCEHGETEQVKRRDLAHELNEGATLGKCHASHDR